MDEDLLNNINEVSTSAPAPQVEPVQPISQPGAPIPQPTPQPQPTVQPIANNKKNKKTAILLFILVIIVSVGIIIGVLFLTGIIGGSKDQNNNGDSSVEVEIEDQTTRDKINQKLSILFGTSSDNGEIYIDSSYYDDVYLYRMRDLTEEQRVWRIFNAMAEDNRITPSEEQLASMQNAWLQAGGVESSINSETLVVYSLSDISAKYEEVFGTIIGAQKLEGNRVVYDPSTELYFSVYGNDVPASTMHRYYYLSEYAQKDNDLHVYVASAQQDILTGEVYCNVFFESDSEKAEVCEVVTESSPFKLNAENYGSFNQNRLDFRTTEDGEIYFVGVEIPSDEESGSGDEVIVVEPDELIEDESEESTEE